MSSTASSSTRELTTAPMTGAAPRDAFLDTVKAVAIGRVIAWHTWSWWWLSWLGAMPAMFFASGALLDRSVARHGYRATVRTRFRRLLIPFWVYSSAAVVVMVVVGWRPSLRELAPWVLPLADPIGSDDTPGLWIPLWYLRAYLWFVLGAALLRAGVTLLGRSVLVLPAVATLGVWMLARNGTELPIAVGDAAVYSFFVLSGMLFARGRSITGDRAVVVGMGAFIAAVGWCVAFGPTSRIVNASYPLTLLAGIGTVAIFLALAPRLRTIDGLPGRVVRVIGSRALTIYLWQGFGLLAADQLVTRQEMSGVAGAGASIVIVVVVTAAAAWAFGWIEDLAARRTVRLPNLALTPMGIVAVAVLVAAGAVQPASGTAPTLVPSGQAVLDRAAFNDDQPDTGPSATTLIGEPAERVRAAFDGWLDGSAGELEGIGAGRVEATIALPSGEIVTLDWITDGGPPEDGIAPWWSMSKALTGAWLAELASDGVVALDDPISTYLPDVPHGDEITLDHLARHQSGIPTEDNGIDSSAVHPRRDLEEWFEHPTLEFETGVGWAYTRRGYFLLTWALEVASGQSWVDRVHAQAATSGTRIVIDDETDAWDETSHPGGGSYRGRLWSAGGLSATPEDTVRYHRWLLTEGLTPEARDLMSSFHPSRLTWNYGLALVPLCPCEEEGPWLRTSRYGLDSLGGTWTFDEDTTATVLVTSDRWFGEQAQTIFYRLQQELLDAVG